MFDPLRVNSRFEEIQNRFPGRALLSAATNSVTSATGQLLALRGKSWSESRRTLLAARITARDLNVWSGRAVQEVFVDSADAVLHQCIRPLIGALCSGLIMDISAPAFSLPDRPQRTIWVTRFRVRREDRTSISFSSSRRPWRVNELFANATQLEACWPRRCDCELARSMRCVRACWRARRQARCGAAASWPPRSNA